LADIIIRFIGDTSGLRGLLQAIGKETNAFVASTNAASQLTLQKRLGLPSEKGLGNQTGSFVRAIKTEMLSYDNVLKTTGQTQLKLFGGLTKEGRPIFLEKTIALTEVYHGNIEQITAASEKYSAAKQRLNAAESESIATGRILAQDVKDRVSLITGENAARTLSTQNY